MQEKWSLTPCINNLTVYMTEEGRSRRHEIVTWKSVCLSINLTFFSEWTRKTGTFHIRQSLLMTYSCGNSLTRLMIYRTSSGGSETHYKWPGSTKAPFSIYPCSQNCKFLHKNPLAVWQKMDGSLFTILFWDCVLFW